MSLRNFYLLCIALITMQLFAETRNQSDGSSIILTKSGYIRPHLINVEEPTANILVSRTSFLSISLDAKTFSNFSINLLSSNGNIDTTFIANSPTLSLPITDNTADYLLTIDGGDYGTYDGVFNTTGDSVTLTETMALRLVKNRRENNVGVNFFVSTVTSLINDNLCCSIDSLPSNIWATNQQEKCLVFIDEYPQCTWGHSCSYYYLPRQVSVTDAINTSSLPSGQYVLCLMHNNELIESISIYKLQ